MKKLKVSPQFARIKNENPGSLGKACRKAFDVARTRRIENDGSPESEIAYRGRKYHAAHKQEITKKGRK